MITIYLKLYNKIIRNADTKLFDELGYDDILWIDMLLPTIKEQKAVENFMEISLQTKQQVEEIESTSKYSENENAIISNSNFFVPTGDTFIVEPVSFIISNEGVLVSVRSAEFRTFRETEKRLQMNYRSYSTGYHLFISLLEVRIDFDADLVELIAKHAAHYKQLGGAQMIALGSDFDGIDGPHQLEDASFLPMLADALRKEGFTEDEVEGVYYRNAMRFFEENL